jgi:hypothetical protein
MNHFLSLGLTALASVLVVAMPLEASANNKDKDANYSKYKPAFHYGVNLYNNNPNLRFEELNEAELRDAWNKNRGSADLSWEDAREPTRDAYTRLYNERNYPNISPSSGTKPNKQ